MGDACVAAVHYGDCYEDMQDFCFSMLRADYERLLPSIVEKALSEGLIADASIETDGGVLYKPFARFGKKLNVSAGESGDDTAWLYLYPLDAIPEQVILRFKLFKEASRLMDAYFSMEHLENFAAYGKWIEELAQLRRFEGLGTGLCACLCGKFSGKRMGERTVFQRTIHEADLFPIRQLPFGERLMPVAKKVSNWTLEMTPQRQQAIKVIQQESLESLVEVDRVCERLDINYFLVGGSMLGALRHQGFIPWDDDTDIGMLRKDYQRFCKGADAASDERYFIQLPKTDKHIHFVYARMRKSGVEYITHYNEDKDFHKGIWVDVFPFDARPKSEAIAKVQRIAANAFARASMGFKRRREYIEADMKLSKAGLPQADLAYLRRYHMQSKLFPVKLCELAYHVAARMFNPFLSGKPNSLYASFIPSYTTISEDEVYPPRVVRYETVELRIPYGAEAFLTRQYGNYEIIPRIHERYAEHGFKYLRTAEGEIIGA